MGYQTAPNGSLDPPCLLYQSMSHTEGTALLFEFEWLLYSTFAFPPNPTPPPPTPPTPIDSVCDITGTEKLSIKPTTFK